MVTITTHFSLSLSLEYLLQTNICSRHDCIRFRASVGQESHTIQYLASLRSTVHDANSNRPGYTKLFKEINRLKYIVETCFAVALSIECTFRENSCVLIIQKSLSFDCISCSQSSRPFVSSFTLYTHYLFIHHGP